MSLTAASKHSAELAQSGYTVALAGNPNAGKTALFNALTGSHYKVGNWPGVTVEKRSGHYCWANQDCCVVDLPGTYSLNLPSKEGSLDQKIAYDYLLSQEADVVINVIDGSNLERHLFLTLQLLELRMPVVVAVNMMDIAKKRGITLNLDQLSHLLACPVVAVVASQGKGMEALRATVHTMAPAQPLVTPFQLSVPPELEAAIRQLADSLSEAETAGSLSAEHLAQRLLEGDPLLRERMSQSTLEQAEACITHVVQATGEDPDTWLASARYTAIAEILSAVVKRTRPLSQTLTAAIDRIVLNRILGVPIFLAVMYCMFVFSINVGGAFQDFFDMSSTALFIEGVSHGLQALDTPAWLTALLAYGMGTGIHTVVTFLPVLAAMFFFLAFLEDSGYMARAAFVMDRAMRALGLSGKSFVPMVVGFGCNVPAILGARALDSQRDRILTILMMPFMSCGARLAIFAVFAAAFFPVGGGEIIFLLYLLSMAAAVFTGFLLRKTVLPGQPAPLVMELPAYHRPRFLPLCRHTWPRLKQFTKRAGLVILPICVLIGAANSVTVTGTVVKTDQESGHSVLSQVGRVVTPILSPMGVTQDNWPATVGLLTGILAKEVVVGTLNTLYTSQAPDAERQAAATSSSGEEPAFNLLASLKAAWQTIPENLMGLSDAFKNPWLANEAPHEMRDSAFGVMVQRFDGQVGAFAYLVFVLLYFPCVSTMAVISRELNRAWAAFSVWWSISFAYAIAVITYQAFQFLHHPLQASLWITAMFAYLLVGILGLRYRSQRSLAFS